MSGNKTDTHEEELADLSRAVIRTWTCACGQEVQTREWIIVDCLNRPDLVSLIKDGSRLFPECPACGKRVNSRMPFALARLSESVPLVLILQKRKEKLPVNLLAILDTVYGRLQKEYGNFPRLTAPVIILPDLLERDIDADLINKSPLLESVEGITYKEFLRIVKHSFDRDKRIRLIIELTGLLSIDEASALLKRAPELLEPEMAALLEEFGSGDSLLAGLHVIQKNFLQQVSENLDIAVQTYLEEKEEFFAQLYGPAEELRQKVEVLAAQGEWQEVLIQAQRGLEFARITKHDFLIAEFTYNSANALCNLPAKTPQDVEQAVSYLEETLQTEAGRERAHVYLQLSAAYGSRSLGDPHVNVERAIALAEEGLRMLDMSASPELWAMANTNLALQYFARDEGAPLENLKRAAYLCEEALKVRLPEINADDWAYTMLNQGLIKIDLLKLTGDASLASLDPIENGQVPIVL